MKNVVGRHLARVMIVRGLDSAHKVFIEILDIIFIE
jgi:hypothetical protein